MVDGSFRRDWQTDWKVWAAEVWPVSLWEEPDQQTVPGSGTEPGERSGPEAGQTADEPEQGER